MGCLQSALSEIHSPASPRTMFRVPKQNRLEAGYTGNDKAIFPLSAHNPEPGLKTGPVCENFSQSALSAVVSQAVTVKDTPRKGMLVPFAFQFKNERPTLVFFNYLL